MSTQVSLLLITLVFEACAIAWWCFWRWAEDKLLSSPAPQAVLEVSVSKGVENSTLVMARLYRKLAGSLSSNVQSRFKGKRQMRVAFHASKKEQTTAVRCLIYVHVEKAEELKRFLKEDFAGQAAVVQLASNPLKPAIHRVQAAQNAK